MITTTIMYPARLHASKTFSALVSLSPDVRKTKPQVIFLSGRQTLVRDDTDRELPFRQESNFLYLSGCHIPGAHLLLSATPSNDDRPPSVRSHLFIPEQDSSELMWSAPLPEPNHIQLTSDIDAVSTVSALPEALSSLAPDALVHTLPRASPRLPALHSALGSATEDEFLLNALHTARLLKTPHEVDLIRHANDISSRAHELIMRVLALRPDTKQVGTHPLLPAEWRIHNEAEAEALFVASCRREGATQQAYMPIVAGAERAATLHYCCNDRVLDRCSSADRATELEPQVLLIDAGCEWECYASDITRTIPVGNGGKFTKEAADIYDLVLEMQNRAIELIKPGVHWEDVHILCHRLLIRGFLALGIFKSTPNDANPESTLFESGLSSAFFPHGVGHSLGLDVHDVPRASKPRPKNAEGTLGGKGGLLEFLRLRIVLQVGMVVTVEPGIYFHKHLLARVRNSPLIDHDVLERYERVGGVRIEDAVHVVEGGCENLTKVGKERAWVESVCGGSN